MAEKRLNARIVHKHDVQSNWEKATNFIPMQGEIICFDIDENYAYERFKIGDGVTNVNDLPFASAQSDWSVNDENAPEYIHNRPFYVDTVENTSTLTIEEQSSDGGSSEDNIFAKLLYENYENCVYEVFSGGGWVAGSIESVETTDVHLSIEISCLLESGNTLGHTVQIANDYSYIDWFRATELAGSKIRFTATATEEIVNKIDPKYLPNGGQSDWSQTDPTQADYIKNRPFYEIPYTDLGSLDFVATSENTIQYTVDNTDHEKSVLQYLQSKSGQSNSIFVHLNGDAGFMTPTFSYGRFSFSGYLSGSGFYWSTGAVWTITVNSDAVSLVTNQTYKIEFYDVTTPDIIPIDEKYLPASVYLDSNAPVRHGNVEYSAVQGKNTVAKANYSHAEGYGTIAASHYQHVQGRYNIEESEERYLHIVGNGHSDTSRSNAHTLDDSGNAWFQGDIFVGGTGQDDPAAKKIATEEYIIESKDFFILKDQISGCDYVLQIKDGNLVTFSRCIKIEVTTPPNKTSYVQGEAFDPAGMIVTATYGDGTTKVFDNYQCSDAVMGDVFFIYYQEYGVTHSAAVNVEITEFDPETELVDFDYVANEDGTYTLTGWKGTLNGVSSTELIVPANGLINIDGGDAL